MSSSAVLVMIVLAVGLAVVFSYGTVLAITSDCWFGRLTGYVVIVLCSLALFGWVALLMEIIGEAV